MGAARTGKTSLITQFLYSRFSPKYKRTVEEMHQGAFSISGVNLTLDILDTSGANEVSLIINEHFLVNIFLRRIIMDTFRVFVKCGCFTIDRTEFYGRLVFGIDIEV